MEKTERYLAVKKNNQGLGLKSIDLLILSQVEEFQNNGLECFMTNEQFSWMFGESVSKVKRSLDRLEELDIVKRSVKFVQGNGRANKQRVLYVNDRSKWKVHSEPSINQNEQQWKVHNEPTIDENTEWKVHSEPSIDNESNNGRFIMNRPLSMEGSKMDNGRFKSEEWKVHNEPIRTNLRENLRTNLDGNFVSSDRHPSGSSRHPSGAERSANASPPKAVSETAEQKTKHSDVSQSKEDYLHTLADDKLERIDYLLSNDERYNDIYEMENIKKGSLNRDSRYKIAEILEQRKKDRQIEEDRQKTISYLDCNDSVLFRLSEYSNSSPDEVRDNLVSYGMSPDKLISCYENSDTYGYDCWNEEYKNRYPVYWDYVNALYDSNVRNSVNMSNSVVGSVDVDINVNTDNTETFSLIDKDIDSMTIDDIEAMMSCW